MSSRSSFLALLFALAAASACDPAPLAPDPGTSSPAVTTYDDPVFDKPPTRIVAANTAVAEFLMLLVPPERVVGVPEQVADYSLFQFDSEAWQQPARIAHYAAEPILALRPDLVITHDWQDAGTTRVLEKQDVALVVLASARSWEDIKATYERLGKLLHCEQAARKQILIRGNTVERLKREATRRPALSAVLYSNDGNAGWLAGRNTTADAIFAMAGVRNAASGFDGHQQADFEQLITLDPDVIVVQQPRGKPENPTLELLGRTKALANLRAVKGRRFVTLDERLVSSDSPTLVDAADDLSLALDDLLAGRPRQSSQPAEGGMAPVGPR